MQRDPAAFEMTAFIVLQRARKQAGPDEHLESVADPEDRSALGNFLREEVAEQALRLEGENATGTERIPVGKTTGNDDQLGLLDFTASTGQIEKIDADRRCSGLLKGKGRVVLTIGAGRSEYNGWRLHDVGPLQACSRSVPVQVCVPRCK